MQLEEAVKRVMRDPRSIQARAMIAAILESMDIEEAKDVWYASIRAAIATGQFFPALTLAHRYLSGPEQLFALRELFLRFGASREQEGVFRLAPIIAKEPIILPRSTKALIAKAIEVGRDITAAGIVDSSIIHEVPIFGKLEEDEFIELAQKIEEVRFQPNQILILQGEEERSVYILAQGEVKVIRQRGPEEIELAKVRGPAIIGEISLLTATPRSATVRTCSSGLAWKISPELISSLSRKNPDLLEHLLNIVKERLLENLLKTSKLFRDPKERALIFPKFVPRSIEPGAIIFRKNSPPPGLFVILRGEIELYDEDETGHKKIIAQLSEGDAFGELSLLSDTPTAATAWMEKGGMLLHLSPEDYHSIKPFVPTINEHLNELCGIHRGALHEPVTPFSVTPYQGEETYDDDRWLIEDIQIDPPQWIDSKDDLPPAQ